MNCPSLAQLHQWIDGELAGRAARRMASHLEECESCREIQRETLLIREALAVRVRLDEVTQRQLWGRIQREVRTTLGGRLAQAAHDLWAALRDLDRRLLAARLLATPVTLAFFSVILMQFPQVSVEWVYPVLSLKPATAQEKARTIMTRVPVRYRSAEIDQLMNAVWKLPYEDSLLLLAEITPQGHAEIGDVLEYPRSQKLLEAVDRSLRRTHFEGADSDLNNSVVLYSFQKVDVYGGEGLD